MNILNKIKLCYNVLTFNSKKCNLYGHSVRELNLIGRTNDEIQNEMNKCVLEIVTVFSLQNHSGCSAAYILNLLENLLKFKNIAPLTGADDEWNKFGDNYWQNNRLSTVFKTKDEVYDINGIVFIDKNGAAYTNLESRVPVTFPYTQNITYVKQKE